METATKIIRNRICLFFDFDGTLGPDTTRTFFEAHDIPFEDFHHRLNERIDQFWQYPLAKADLLREYSHREDSLVRRRELEAFGAEFPLFEGVETLVERLREDAREIDEEIELEFIMLTAGFKSIPENSVVGKQFDRVYGGELNFDHDGRVLGARRVISHVDKVHYIKQVAQGLDLNSASELERTYVYRKPEDYYVPLSQVVYVGDGSSDMSAFQIVEEGGGIAIAIDPDPESDWDGYEDIAPGRRVHNIAEADYRDDSDLMRSLQLSVKSMIHRIQLLRMGEGQ